MNRPLARMMTSAIGALVLLVGCSNRPQLQSVEGTVTLDGKPVEGATVSLLPDHGLPATGLTDPQGCFTISTIGERGCKPGAYAVVVTKTKRPATDDSADSVMPGEETTGKASIQHLLPKKYGQADTSGLKVLVQPGMKPVELKLASQ